jgi:hypothetical protein
MKSSEQGGPGRLARLAILRGQVPQCSSLAGSLPADSLTQLNSSN